MTLLRRSGRKVILIGHVPPLTHNRHSLYKKNCRKHYTNIIGSFSDIIMTQYFGHVNWDIAYAVTKLSSNNYELIPITTQLMKSRSASNMEIVGSFFTGPSIVPFFNSGFRLGTVTDVNDTSILESHHQYFANLAQHNLDRSLNIPVNSSTFFESSCSTKKWNLKTLEPGEWPEFFKAIQQELHRSKRSDIVTHYHKCASVHSKVVAIRNPDLSVSNDFMMHAIIFLTVVFVVGITVTLFYGEVLSTPTWAYFVSIFRPWRRDYEPIE
jgi:hypothetical protein